MSAAVGLLLLAGGASGCATRPAKAADTTPKSEAPAADAPADVSSLDLDRAEGGGDDLGGEASTLEEALREMEDAERRIAQLFPSRDAESPSEEQEASPAPAQPQGQTKTTRTRADRCPVACRALSSMQRSAERLCELAGEDDTRCADAQGRLERAERVVERACPACRAGD